MSSVANRNPIAAQQQLKALLRDYFVELDEAARDPATPVAWCTSVGPCEILTALGCKVYFPENHSALLAARKLAREYIPYAVAAGYCAESCSYMTGDIGAALAGYTPLRDAYRIDERPRPDVLVYSTNQCREVQDWWTFFGQRYGAPVAGICPPRHLGEITPEHVRFVRAQLVELIEQLETCLQRKLDTTRLEEVVAASSRTSTLWKQVLDTAEHRPAPLTFWDGAVHMAPVVVMRGDERAICYYELLLAEMRQRIADGVGAVPQERFRLYWEGMPIWPRLRELAEKFYALNAVIAASTYCNSWVFEPYEDGDPLEWMARTSISIFINRDEPTKQQMLLEMLARFSIDGVIFHNARTCPNNTNTHFGMPQRLRDLHNLPVLVIDGDLCDARFFSTAQTMTNIEAFIEQLEGLRA